MFERAPSGAVWLSVLAGLYLWLPPNAGDARPPEARTSILVCHRFGPVVAAADGHRPVFTDMLPLVRELGIPVTLFIYPSAISNAAYAMTWDRLRTLDRRVATSGDPIMALPRFPITDAASGREFTALLASESP